MSRPRKNGKITVKDSLSKKKKTVVKSGKTDEERRVLEMLEGEDFETTDFLFISDWSDAGLTGERDK